MSLPLFTLRAYQSLNVSRICRRILHDGKRHILYAAPMASGKTLVGKALAARLLGPLFSTVLILGPSNNIVERWREPVQVRSVERNMLPRTYGKQLDLTGKLPRLDTAQALHGDGSFWNGEEEGVWVGTRQGVCDQKVIDLLLKMKREGRNVEHVCVLVDEGHHHFKENQGGKFCKAITDLGGTVILLTGTPWHSGGALTDEDSGEVHYPWSPYARETDNKGRLIAPQNWRVEHERVQECETDDLSLVVDDGFEAKTDLSDAKRKVMIKRIVARFVADGCPKTVINVPRRAPWVAEMISALERSTKVRNALKALKRPPLRAFDFTGGSAEDTQRIDEIEELMSKDANSVKRYSDSKIDVIVACARMNEGTDWPLCSHVYNVRIPNSMSLIMQRWSRASRSKINFAGYPREHANTQTLVFFSPTVTGEAGANFWAKHRNIALATASLLEDYRVTQKYVNVCPSLSERFKKVVEADNQPDIDGGIDDLLDDEDHDQAWEGTEHARAQAMAKVVEFIERRGGEVSVPELAAFIKSKAKGNKDLAAEMRQAAIVHLERVNPEIATLVREHRTKSRTRAKRSGDSGGELIKRDMEDVWEAVAANFPHVMVSTPADVKQMAMFTPEDAPQLVERLREGDGRNEPEENALAIVAFHKEHGWWPRFSMDSTDEGRLGRALNNLRVRHPDICVQHDIPLTARPLDYLDQQALSIVAWGEHKGRWPRKSSGDAEERRLGNALKTLRRTHPDVCARHSIPLRAHDNARLAESLLEFFTTNGHFPRKGVSGETKLAGTLRNLRTRHPEVCREYNIPLAAYDDSRFTHWAKSILDFFRAQSHWPRSGVSDETEAFLGRRLSTLRAGHPDICERFCIPLTPTGGRVGVEQFKLCGQLCARLGRNFPVTRKSQNVEGDTGGALNVALQQAHIKPSKSRGLGFSLDICQVNSLARANFEIEHDCWRFTLKGAGRPDKRPWAAILAAGDNKKIEKAERVAFLDWENPDAGSIPLPDVRGNVCSHATRRPWSLPVATAKAS